MGKFPAICGPHLRSRFPKEYLQGRAVFAPFFLACISGTIPLNLLLTFLSLRCGATRFAFTSANYISFFTTQWGNGFPSDVIIGITARINYLSYAIYMLLTFAYSLVLKDMISHLCSISNLSVMSVSERME